MVMNVPMWVELRFSTADRPSREDVADFMDAARELADRLAPPAEDNLTFRSDAGELVARFHTHIASPQAANRWQSS